MKIEKATADLRVESQAQVAPAKSAEKALAGLTKGAEHK